MKLLRVIYHSVQNKGQNPTALQPVMSKTTQGMQHTIKLYTTEDVGADELVIQGRVYVHLLGAMQRSGVQDFSCSYNQWRDEELFWSENLEVPTAARINKQLKRHMLPLILESLKNQLKLETNFWAVS